MRQRRLPGPSSLSDSDLHEFSISSEHGGCLVMLQHVDEGVRDVAGTNDDIGLI